ncbi:MAG: CRTAC1 family protein [Gemmatimonadaceae bacterium]|jgi:hypothetical protein|nr:CRTAC1 family protein [Gemmatimonadaceae bacterium]
MRSILVACCALPLLATSTAPTLVPVQPADLALGGSFTNAVADIDNDGDLDLFVGFGGAPNRLYRNDGSRLVDIARALGLDDVRGTRAAAWGDMDADGDPDLLVGFAPAVGSVLALYRNDGGRFTDVTRKRGLWVSGGAVRQPAWVDVDGDSDLDLFVAFRDRANLFFRNDGERFVEVGSALGLADARKTVGASWADLDEDGDLDLVTANQDGDANGLFRNDGARFTDVADAAGLAWGGRAPRNAQNGTVRPCIDDVDHNGRLDLFFANYGPNGLFLRQSAGYRDVSTEWGVAIDGRYDACAFADIDHDGRLDLYVNGTVTGGKNYPDYLFMQDSGRLIERTPANVRALAADHGVTWFDLDQDGALDLALTGVEPSGMHLVLRNTTPAPTARSIAVRVLDARGRATRAGAEVRVYRNGSRDLLGTRVVDAGSGYNAQSDQPVHVGVGAARRVDVEVTWPSRGQRRSTWRRGVPTDGQRGASVVVTTTGAP